VCSFCSSIYYPSVNPRFRFPFFIIQNSKDIPLFKTRAARENTHKHTTDAAINNNNININIMPV